MEHRSSVQLMFSFTLFSFLYFRAHALPLLGADSAISNNALEDQNSVRRRSDAVFTDNYSTLLREIYAKKYLNSVLKGKRSTEEIYPANHRDDRDLSEPSFSEN
ncbi:VIP peptides-like [Lissotriton helveticus]